MSLCVLRALAGTAAGIMLSYNLLDHPKKYQEGKQTLAVAATIIGSGILASECVDRGDVFSVVLILCTALGTSYIHKDQLPALRVPRLRFDA